MLQTTKPDLVNALATLLSDSVVAKYVFQGAHWNVIGQDFHQFHAMFAEFYTDLEGAIDTIAEDIRKLDAPAPSMLSDFLRLSNVTEMPTGYSVQELLRACFTVNEILLNDINVAFEAANSANEQGIADDMAARDSTHKKWRWIMKASLESEVGY